MGSSAESVNDLLSPGRILFAVNSSGRILRLETHGKANGSTQGWRVSTLYFSISITQLFCLVHFKECR